MKNILCKYFILFTFIVALSNVPTFASGFLTNIDCNDDNIPDQIVLKNLNSKTYLVLIDGATSKELSKVEVYPDRNNSPSIDVINLQGHIFINYFAWDGQPWSRVFEIQSNQLVDLPYLSQTSVQISYYNTNQVKLTFPSLSGWDQSFKLSSSNYKELKNFGTNSWYPSTVTQFKDNKLFVQTSLHFPPLTNLEYIEIIEEYQLIQGKWILKKATTKSNDKSTFSPLSFTPPTPTINLIINNKPITNSNMNPIKQGNLTLIPLRLAGDYLGATVKWSSPNISLTKGDKTLKLTIGSKTAFINGKSVTLETAPIIQKGITFVPVRFVSENLEATVAWDNATNTITINSISSSSSSSTPYAMLGEGYLDFINFKIGSPMKNVTNQLGMGKYYTFQGVIVHDYGNYCLNESLENPILVGGFFNKGASIYGVTIGTDTSTDVVKKLGSQYTKSIPSDGDELIPSSTAYTYSYSNNGNYLNISFDVNHKSIFASFIAN